MANLRFLIYPNTDKIFLRDSSESLRNEVRMFSWFPKFDCRIHWPFTSPAGGLLALGNSGLVADHYSGFPQKLTSGRISPFRKGSKNITCCSRVSLSSGTGNQHDLPLGGTSFLSVWLAIYNLFPKIIKLKFYHLLLLPFSRFKVPNKIWSKTITNPSECFLSFYIY